MSLKITPPDLMRPIHGKGVYGVDLDAATRCAHWHSPLDIVAIKFNCCGRWYACFECHGAIAGHQAEKWPNEKFGENAILCGACGREHSIHQYLACENSCSHCGSPFNPGCAKHRHLYFE